jgi:hypothetical protein
MTKRLKKQFLITHEVTRNKKNPGRFAAPGFFT